MFDCFNPCCILLISSHIADQSNLYFFVQSQIPKLFHPHLQMLIADQLHKLSAKIGIFDDEIVVDEITLSHAIINPKKNVSIAFVRKWQL